MIYVFILMAITGLLVLFAFLKQIMYILWEERMYKSMFPLPYKIIVVLFLFLLIALFVYGVFYVYDSLKICLWT